MMITLSNGHKFEFLTASGAMAYDGKGWPWEWPLRWCGLLDARLFTHVTKTLTFAPRKGNFRRWCPWRCINMLKGGAVNSIGLTNPGIGWWLKKVAPKIDLSATKLIVSIFGSPAELALMAAALNDCNIVGVEVNASCPNTQEDVLANAERAVQSCTVVKRNCRHPVLAKLSVAHDVSRILPGLEGVVEAINVNSVPWAIAFPYRKSPLARFGGGGVSGKIAQPFTWPFAERLKGITKIPVIAPSVWDYADIARLRSLGFPAIAFGSIFMRYPWQPTLFVKKDRREQSV